ncbi:hypothetical protein NMK71_11565 [Weeksellaceae bacterium KMM 9713]|uniref:Uncharacterized protein n=1 Tax=Profundicola chukchiensis TaxID=2961959 RepID=A0A9X4N091_9FLAO|nr:hypothetical protein [Profundicola chukchiensis]MDG4947050.1 hypothetical protein [Profundicola chukchiensis]
MKNIYIILFTIVGFSMIQAQVAIEKDNVTNNSVLLEFNDQAEGNTNGKAKSIILPWVGANKTGEQGTIVYDATDKKVKLLKEGDVWVDLTNAGTEEVSNEVQGSTQDNAGVEITDGTFTESAEVTADAQAVLKLNSKDKALVLPRVNGIEEVVNPQPGALVYDLKSKSIAVFNGSLWHFWN